MEIQGLPAGSKVMKNGYVQLPNGRIVPPSAFGVRPGMTSPKDPAQMSAKRADTIRLLDACKDFNSVSDAPYNTVYPGEFAKFAPLFSTKAMETLSKDVINRLRKEYGTQFSLRHPIYIISPELDPKGAYYFKDKQHHKVLATLPPAIRNYKTLNALGRTASNLIASFMNASANTENPLDHRVDQYASQIALALKAVNKDIHEQPVMPADQSQPQKHEEPPVNSASNSGSAAFDFDFF